MKFKILTGEGQHFGFIEISEDQVHKLLNDGQWLVFEPFSVIGSDSPIQHPVTVSMSCMSVNTPEDPDPHEVADKAIAIHKNVFEENTNGN
jgi:hypothetical protein